MKKILGLDLGSASIGWAVVVEENDRIQIESIGSRIIPLSVTDADEFTKGNTISKNASRTEKRTQRKGYDRYQQRRTSLTQLLKENQMLSDEGVINLEKLELWGLRAKGCNEQLTLPQIGRVLYHINQKRGYKAIKSDYDLEGDKKQGEYVKSVMGRHKEITEQGITIGQKFFKELSNNSAYRTKEQVFPRKAYEEEFDAIVACQKGFYPSLFTEEMIDKLRNRIIFYQRGLKSCKHLVSICDFEKKEFLIEERVVVNGPKVAPKSSPLAQVCKIWESVNNVTLKNKRGDELYITTLQRLEMFQHLDNNDKLTLTDLYRILDIRKSDGWWGGKAIGKGLQGNTTKNAIRKALGGEHNELLRFGLSKKETHLVDPETGEIIQIISDSYMDEPLHALWHVIYSIKEREQLEKVLRNKFGISDSALLNKLLALDFVKQGYTNKSAKAMRRILPYLELGLKYSDACLMAGFRHSESLTLEENQNRVLLSSLKPIKKNELRQPVVEKILNQMINVVNALMEKHGPFDEIRVELARELKQSKEERNQTTRDINKNEKDNAAVAKIIQEYTSSPTRSQIQKYKMWREAEERCFYCNQTVNVAEFLQGVEVEVEHILPRSVFFDDSFSNKVCACRKCNQEKNSRTAYDYMMGKSDEEFNLYLERIERMYKDGKISKTKYERLLTPGDKIPTDFISRQLRESQYIATKSREILTSVCRNVTSTSGGVTSFVRHTWGYDKILHNLNFERHKHAGLTEVKKREHKGQTYTEEVIKEWSKRLDHRHHAIDALVVACTKQGYIQRMNDMKLIDEVDNTYKRSLANDTANTSKEEYKIEKEKVRTEKSKRLERYIFAQPHPSTSEVERAIDSILVSFKAGKKAASVGKRYIHRGGKRIVVQERVVTPRGALHAESVYGNIDRYSKNRKGETVTETHRVLKYPITSIVRKDIEFIVDGGIKKLVNDRFKHHTGKEADIWKDIESHPLLFNGEPIKSIRCLTGIKADSIATLDRGAVQLKNNHHVGVYIDREGKRRELCVTFWHAVERKYHKLPLIITQPNEVWDNLPDKVSEEFLAQLPPPDWRFEVSLQQNEMFILGVESETLEEALNNNDYALLGKSLYRVQKIASNDYWFRLHTETINDITAQGREAKKYYRLGIKGFNELHPVKVRISLLGKITKV